MFATGSHDNSASCLCVALKRQIIVYEFNRSKQRHLKFKVTFFFHIFRVISVLKDRYLNLWLHKLGIWVHSNETLLVQGGITFSVF